MDDRVARLEAAVAVLTDHVRDLELRLGTLERGREGVSETQHSPVAGPGAPDFEGVPLQQWLALVGRTLVVLGGAYLLRALTDSQVLTAPVGVAFGLLYGAPWLLLASRAGARGAQLDALCHALATALIGYPLVWEATLRFGVLGPPQSAALLGALTAAALVLAAVTRLHGLAWVVTFGAFGSAAGLALATGDWNSYTLLSIGLGLATLWLGYIRGWGDLRWPAAAGANLMLVFAIDHAALNGAAPGGMLLLLLLAFAGYTGSFAVRTLAATRRVTAFDAVQSAAVIVIALGGSLYLLRSSNAGVAIGAAALALGVAVYALAFAFVQQRRDVTAFFFWALFGLVLAAIGTTVCAGVMVGSLVYAASAATLAVFARRRGSLTLDVHASLCALAASVGSGLLAVTSAALVASPAGWRSLDAVALLALIALAGVVLMPGRPIVSASDSAMGSLHGSRLFRLILAGVLAWTSMGVAILLATSVFGDPRRVDPSVLATLRTSILVGGTLVLARVARYDSGREAGWLMYPLLVATGLKLVLVDLPLGRPQTLFAALALYGFALIMAPRLLRGGSPPDPIIADRLASGSPGGPR
jgi:hypothetical protein